MVSNSMCTHSFKLMMEQLLSIDFNKDNTNVDILKKDNTMQNEWPKKPLMLIYKNKGDILNNMNYRGIKLMSQTMKLRERVIEHKLRHETRVSDNQFGSMLGCSAMEATISYKIDGTI